MNKKNTSSSRMYELYSLGTALFGVSGWIFEATKAILEQQKLAGIRLNPNTSASYLKESSSRRIEDEDDGDLQPPLYNSKIRDENTSPLLKGIKARHVSTEMVDEIASLMAFRLTMTQLPGKVTVSNVDQSLSILAAGFMKTGHRFDIDAYAKIDRRIMPEVAIIVMEIMHRTARPEPQLIRIPSNSASADDIYLKLWQHPYLQIPLILQNGEGGVFGRANMKSRPNSITCTPKWMEAFRELLVISGHKLGLAWESRFPGVQTPKYSVSEWTASEMASIIDCVYDGWIWMLAFLHWTIWMVCASESRETFISTKGLFRHFICGIRIAEGHYSDKPIQMQAFDLSRISINLTSQWKIAAEHRDWDVSTPMKTLNCLKRCNIITVNEDDDQEEAHSTRIVTKDSIEDFTSGRSKWEQLSGLFDTGIYRYIKIKEYL